MVDRHRLERPIIDRILSATAVLLDKERRGRHAWRLDAVCNTRQLSRDLNRIAQGIAQYLICLKASVGDIGIELSAR